jgi:hypothetical protein
MNVCMYVCMYESYMNQLMNQLMPSLFTLSRYGHCSWLLIEKAVFVTLFGVRKREMGQLTLHLLSLSTTQWGLSYQGIGLIWCSPPAVNSSEDRKIERNGANVFRTKLDRPLSNKNMTDCFQTKLDRPLSNKIGSTTVEKNWIDRLSNKIGSTAFEQNWINRFRTKFDWPLSNKNIISSQFQIWIDSNDPDFILWF